MTWILVEFYRWLRHEYYPLHWIRVGLMVEKYPLCCVLFICGPLVIVKPWAAEHSIDGYVPCPIHVKMMEAANV